MTKNQKTKINNTVKDGAKKVKASKVAKINNKKTTSEQKDKKLKRTYAKIKDKELHALSMKMSKQYGEYIKSLNNKDLYNLLKLHKFDMEFWKDYILEYKIDNKEKLIALVNSLCKYLYYENSTFLKYLKSKEYKDKQDSKVKEDSKVKDNNKKSFNKAIKKQVKKVIIKDNKETNK